MKLEYIVAIVVVMSLFFLGAGVIPGYGADKKTTPDLVQLSQQLEQARTARIITEDRVRWLQSLVYQQQKSVESLKQREATISKTIEEAKKGAKKVGKTAPEPVNKNTGS